ncbi:MAG TPA: hypothetical protein PKM59_02840 [Thermodesulfobacteriota bacterium]|nr:hypothetical protein [Deltaproteobacteria bacterium]HNR12231.1 hypothetical protein [Thermodesulfobacteriota bacterium]HNU71185.1 hypothetical protein [Thermodesulfobacteriota bacterium]
MSLQHCSGNRVATHRFSVKEKILMGMAIYGAVAVGIYGIYLQSGMAALFYFGFVSFAMLFLFGYGLCSHCPYIYKEYKDCLFPPWGHIYRRIFTYRPGKFNLFDKACFFGTLVGIFAIPIPWLMKTPVILASFLVFYGATVAGFALYECKRCQHGYCPFNKNETWKNT